MERRRVIAIVVGVVVLLVGLGVALWTMSGDDDDEAVPASSTTSSTTSTSTSSTTTAATTAPTSVPATTQPPCPPFSGTTDPKQNETSSGGHMLTDVLVSGGPCTDTVTMSFRGDGTGPVGYQVEYQSGPFTEDPSDLPLPVSGSAFLVVRLFPAYGYDFETGEPAYTGSKRIAGSGTKYVTEVVEMGDFEGVMTWVIGVSEQRPFTVSATGAPTPLLEITIG